jgi:Reverse transcriptase (RNA-dependent DNA polymerase)
MNAIHNVNAGENDGNAVISADHFKNSCVDLCVYLSFLFPCMLVHDAIPDNFTTDTVISIPKGKNTNLPDSNNYRGIALKSIFGKIFDKIFIDKHYDDLSTSELQFGFKKKRSTNQCSMVLKETIAYYVKQHNMAYCSMLDATKAFDRVQ